MLLIELVNDEIGHIEMNEPKKVYQKISTGSYR